MYICIYTNWGIPHFYPFLIYIYIYTNWGIPHFYPFLMCLGFSNGFSDFLDEGPRDFPLSLSSGTEHRRHPEVLVDLRKDAWAHLKRSFCFCIGGFLKSW